MHFDLMMKGWGKKEAESAIFTPKLEKYGKITMRYLIRKLVK